MSEKDYRWERFWCPRSANYSLADGGYLVDPRERWSAIKSPLVTREAIADVPCLILLGEPGIGKSSEIQKLKTLTDEKIRDTDRVSELIDLGSCTDLKKDIFEEDFFTDWLKGTHHLYLFLDSFDEGRLSIQNLAKALRCELEKSKYRNHIDRLHLRLTCRSFVFPPILEEGLKSLWTEEHFKVYELAPLRRADVIEAAREEGFSPDDFLQEVEQKSIVPFAIKPITLGFLLNLYRPYNGQFPADWKLFNFYFKGCKLLSEETSPSRRGANQVGKFIGDQRLIVSARIAAIMMFGNRSAVWTEIDRGNISIDDDVFLEKLCFVYDEQDRGNEFKIDRDAIAEVLDTGLFSSRGLHRMGWSHQTYAEFLAAWYLEHHKVPLEQIRGLIFSSEKPDRKLIPQLHETAAWLASMRPDVLQEIIKTDPEVILQSDVPTDADVRAAIIENLLMQYEEEKLFAPFRGYYYYDKLNHPKLAEQLRPYICDSSKRSDTRELAIYIAEICKLFELQEEFINLALDPSQEIYLRVIAAKTLGNIGETNAKLQLKSLAIDVLPEDEDDQLKGYALQTLWPDHLTVEELFQALTPPKKCNFFGSYQSFLYDRIITPLKPNDLVFVLNWLERQGVRRFGHPFEILGDAILGKAWDNFDLIGVAEGFTKVALVQRREYQEIITSDSQLQERFTSSISMDSQKRRALIEQGILQISKIEGEPYLLDAFAENTIKPDESIVRPEDLLWMLDRFKNSESEQEQKTWSMLIDRTFKNPESMPEEAKAILDATQNHSILRDQFSYWVEPVNLDSAEAFNLRNQVSLNYKRYDYTLTTPPQEKVLQCLETLEAGDLSAWWKLNRDMTLRPNIKSYHNELELDLTKLPGWQDANESTRTRIIEGAKTYIKLKDDINYDWIGTNTLKYSELPELSGCKALCLLLKKDADFINNLSLEKWKNWASVIIAIPAINQREGLYLELVRLAYFNAPQESINTLLTLIDRDNREHNYIFATDHFDRCWDERLKSTLLEKAKDPTLKPKCVGQILDELLRREFVEARSLATSLIPTTLPLLDREKALIATKLLIDYSDSSDWPLIWSLIQDDTSFGREVFELTAYHYSRGLQLNLTETQLADLYIWLVRQYPHDEDPDYSNESMAHAVTAREAVGNFRDNVLTQLRERSNDRACIEIQRLIQELPHLPWLKKVLADIQTNTRRENWQPLTPEELLQLIHRHRTSPLDIIERIDRRTEQMADEPKIDRRVQINNSQVNGMINTGEGNITEGKTEPPNTKKGVDWKYWLALIVTVFVSGLFNEEIQNFLFKRDGSPVPPNQPKLEKRVDQK